MADTPTIGIPFNLDESWMGGAYYLRNVVTALATLDRAAQPPLVIITHDSKSYAFMRESGYAKLSIATPEQVLASPRRLGINLLFSYTLPGMESRTLSWIPDFQERHLPYLFTEEEIAGRTAWHQSCLASAGLLLSSESAHADLMRFYGETQVPVFVVPFATFLPEDRPERDALFERYDLPERYFFLPNQFWIHKNHIVVFAALRALAKKGVFPQLCCSGKEFDTRAEGYGAYLRDLATEWGITDQIRFMGFLPREDQVAIMDHAIAVVQPSRFEGWSTVVEDAKALSQHVIASSLDVHHEQMIENCDFFDPSDHKQLAELLERYWETAPDRTPIDYVRAQAIFGEALLSTFTALSRANPLPPPSPEDEPRPLAPGNTVLFRAPSIGTYRGAFGVGWSGPEETHIWSLGGQSDLWLSATEATRKLRFTVSGNPYVPEGRQQVELLVNDASIGTFTSDHGATIAMVVDCTHEAWCKDKVNRIAIRPSPTASPAIETGDTRLLGVCLWKVEAL